MTVKPLIRPLRADDFPHWLVLWNDNNQGLKNEQVTTATWLRLTDPASAVKGFGAFDKEGNLIGLVHYILHPVTGALAPACYMQDLFVAPAARQKGIGRALVEHLAAQGKKEQWARLYWLAEARNEAAQALYKTLGHKLDFTLHVMMV